MGNKTCCGSKSQQTLDAGPRIGSDPKKTAKMERQRKKKLQKQVKNGKGPTAAALHNKMQFSDDEEKEHDKNLKHRDEKQSPPKRPLRPLVPDMAQRQLIDTGNNTRPSSNEEDVEDRGTRKDEISKESNGQNPNAITHFTHFEDSFNTRSGSN